MVTLWPRRHLRWFTAPSGLTVRNCSIAVNFLLILLLIWQTGDHMFSAPVVSLTAFSSVASTSTSTTTTTIHPNDTLFSLLVTLRFANQESKTQFLNDFRRVAEYVRDHEPETTSYQCLFSEHDPLQLLILERYRHKESSYLQVHRSSPVFLQFRRRLKEMETNQLVVIAGHSYLDSSVGFMDRT